MRFLWPSLLPVLLVVPLLLTAYLWILRRKRRFAIRYSSLSLIRDAMPQHSFWRRHLPFALYLVSLTGLALGLARPVAQIEVPLSRTTIVLALDISRSMCATDVSPNRLTVAQEATIAFIEGQTEGTQIGLVAFADFAEIVVPPTNDQDLLHSAIQNLSTSLGTAIGSAILKSIDAIAETNPEVAPSGLNLRTEEDPEPMQDLRYLPDIVVLLTDGANTRGPLPLDAAQQAADRGVRVYTIGFGSLSPPSVVCTQQQLGSDVFGGGFAGGFTGGGGGFRRFLLLDEPTLQGVADLTGGSYFRAEDAGQLLEIFMSLPAQITLQREDLEVSALFLLIGGVFALLAVGLSLRWNRLT